MKTVSYVAEVQEAALVVIEQGQIRTCRLNTEAKRTVGRRTPTAAPDISLISPIAGRHQGELACLAGEWFWINGESRNGTYYNGRKIEPDGDGNTRPIKLDNGDVLRIDTPDFRSPNGVWMLFTTDGVGEEWTFYSMKDKDEVVIGRDPSQSRIAIQRPYISAVHARITCRDGRYYLDDCHSAAGTWLNGRRISGQELLQEKDRISLCDINFIYSGDNLIFNPRKPKTAEEQKRVILSADIESKTVPDQSGSGAKELIRNVKLEICEGELVALLGGSGAGKSTLMNCLNGMELQGVKGRVTFCGEDLYANFERLKFLIGNVPQKNVLHEMLTVEEEIWEAAVTRLPADMSSQEIRRRVDETISLLRLDSVRRSRIHKISGGEMQRVNIAIDLAADKTLIL